MTTTLPNGIRVTGDLAKLRRLVEQKRPTDAHRQALHRAQEEAIIMHLLMDERS